MFSAEAVRNSMSMIIILKTLLMIAILCFSVAYVRLFKTPQVLIKKSRSENETKRIWKLFEVIWHRKIGEMFNARMTTVWGEIRRKFRLFMSREAVAAFDVSSATSMGHSDDASASFHRRVFTFVLSFRSTFIISTFRCHLQPSSSYYFWLLMP